MTLLVGSRLHHWTIVGWYQWHRVERCSCGAERTPRVSSTGAYPRAVRNMWLYRVGPEGAWTRDGVPAHPVEVTAHV